MVLISGLIGQVHTVESQDDGEDSSRSAILQRQTRNWSEASLIESIRNMFVTGSWKEQDANKVQHACVCLPLQRHATWM